MNPQPMENVPSPDRKWRLPDWLSRVLLWSGTVLCCILLFDLSRSYSLEIKVQPFSIVALVTLSLGSLAAASVAWRSHFLALSGIRLEWPVAARQLSAVLLGKYVPGKVSGIAARILENRAIASARTVIGATAAEQSGSLLSAFVVGSAAYLAHTNPLTAVFALGCMVALVVLAVPHIAGAALKHLAGISAIQTGAISRALAAQMTSWLILAIIVMLTVHMITGNTSDSILFYVSFAYAAAVVVGQLAFIFPGGIGPREGVFVWLLSAQMSTTDAVAIAATMRIATTAIDLLSCASYLMPVRRPHTQRDADPYD